MNDLLTGANTNTPDSEYEAGYPDVRASKGPEIIARFRGVLEEINAGRLQTREAILQAVDTLAVKEIDDAVVALQLMQITGEILQRLDFLDSLGTEIQKKPAALQLALQLEAMVFDPSRYTRRKYGNLRARWQHTGVDIWRDGNAFRADARLGYELQRAKKVLKAKEVLGKLRREKRAGKQNGQWLNLVGLMRSGVRRHHKADPHAFDDHELPITPEELDMSREEMAHYARYGADIFKRSKYQA